MACSCQSDKLKILADLAASFRVIVEGDTGTPPLVGVEPNPGSEDPCDACKNAPCADVPAGKVRVLVCDGKTVKPLAGTANGQVLKWNQTDGTWDISNA